MPLPDSGRGVEALERAFRDTGRVLLSGAGLVLASVGSEDWIRVGTPPPPEWAGWRYGSDLPRTRRRPGLMERILRTLPPPPLEGWDPYGLGRSGSLHEWVGSPFIEAAATLGRTFRRVPLAAACPGCGAPLWIEPREFERIRFLPDSGGARPMVRIRCASCDREEAVPVRSARAGIRIGLAAVDPGDEAREMAREAGRELAISGGSDAWIASLAQEEMALGEIDSVGRCALRIALDEWAEAEALREGWGRSEELSTLVHLGEGGAA